MSCRAMYYKIKPSGIGRDRFEELCRQLGFVIGTKLNYKRTTNSLGVTRFENLMLEAKITSINQAYVSDITYWELKERFYYLTFITDAYSRRIIGHSVSETLSTEYTTLKAFKYLINHTAAPTKTKTAPQHDFIKPAYPIKIIMDKLW